MTELKPCPFCGSEIHIVRGFSVINMFVCDKCGANVCFDGKKKGNESVKAWNRRAK